MRKAIASGASRFARNWRLTWACTRSSSPTSARASWSGSPPSKARTFARHRGYRRKRPYMPAEQIAEREDPESQGGRATADPEGELFLDGPRGRGFELGRAFRIFWQLIYGFRSLHFVG